MARRISVELIGDSRSLERSFRRAGGAAGGFNRSMTGVHRRSRGAFLGMARFASIGLLSGGGVGAALASTISKAADFQRSLNVLQAVSGATRGQMKAVSATAVKLGADITLPATSAKDAADAMLELSKGGLSVRDSMAAARGTLQLAAAGQLEGAEAAQIQVNALNQFRLGGSKASLVADVLANTASAASGEVTDMATALTYVGPIAAGLGVSITDTGTAIGLLAKNGILSDKAGTGLRAMMVSLAKPTKQNAVGLKALGINAFDSAGHFKGMRYVIEQLHRAQGTMTQKTFTMNAALAFGRIPLSQVIALAKEGGGAFDAMGKKVGKQGGAATLAAARNKGFKGALDGLKSAIETVQIQLGMQLLPTLTRFVKSASTWLSSTRNQKKIMDTLKTTIASVAAVLRTMRAIFRTLSTVLGGNRRAVIFLIGALVAFRALKMASTVAGMARNFGLLGGNIRRTTAATRGAKGGLTAMRGSLIGKAGLVGAVGLASFALTRMFLKLTGLDKRLRKAGGTAFDLAAKLRLVNDPGKQFEGKTVPTQASARFIRERLARLQRRGLTERQSAAAFLKSHPNYARRDVEVLAGVHSAGRIPHSQPIVVHTNVHLNGQKVGSIVTEAQRKAAKRNTTQRRGRIGGR